MDPFTTALALAKSTAVDQTKKLLKRGVERVRQEWADCKVEAYYRDVAVHLGSRDPVLAQEAIEARMKQPGAIEALGRGFQAVMQAVDDHAQFSIAALVAEYFYKEKNPDVAYRRVGNILADCSNDELHALNKLVSAMVKVAVSNPTYVVILDEQSHADAIPPAVVRNRIVVRALSPALSSVARVSIEPYAPELVWCSRSLIRHGFCRDWHGAHGGGHTGDELATLEGNASLEAIRLLHRCLSVSREEQ